MIPRIRLVSIITNNIEEMTKFYKEVLGFTSDEEGEYTEFKHDGVRFALCSKKLTHNLTGYDDYLVESKGQSFELAFWLPTKDEVDEVFKEIVEKGATPIFKPHDMPWGQRTAVFADPDGNCHELYAD